MKFEMNKINWDKYHILPELAFFLFSLFMMRKVYLGAIPLYLLLLLLALLVLLGRKLGGGEQAEGGLKERIKKNKIRFSFFCLALLGTAGVFFTIVQSDGIEVEFFTLLIIVCLTYQGILGERNIGKRWFSILTFLSGLGSLEILLYFLGVEPFANWFSIIEKTTDTIAAYLILPGIFSVVMYCYSKVKYKRMVSFAIALITFLALFLNQHYLSIWIMALVLLTISCIYRPRAELIKRDMKLFFSFMFLLCNMSLLVNYTGGMILGISYSLETSVYGELILAIGGVIFFHFWDKIPEGEDLRRVKMVKLQRWFQGLFLLLIVTLIVVPFCGGLLAGLPQQGILGFVRAVFLPLSNELQLVGSNLLIAFQDMGVMLSCILFLGLGILGKRIYGTIRMGKGAANLLFVVFWGFLGVLLLWEISTYMIAVYAALLALGSSIQKPEEKQE